MSSLPLNPSSAEAHSASVVLAALDSGPAARPTLEAAIGFAELVGGSVIAVHVREPGADSKASGAERYGVPVRVLDGEVETVLLGAAAEPSVVAVVIGARSRTGGRRPVGHVARHIVEQLKKPVVVVPPTAVDGVPRYRRVLVPLEGAAESTSAVAEQLFPLLATDVELVVLHVFTEETAPPVLDRPSRDLAIWGDEFLAHNCPSASRIEWRSGAVGVRVAEMSGSGEIDLVVLSWSQVTEAGHASVIREVLGRCAVPVLLLPIGRPTARSWAPRARR